MIQNKYLIYIFFVNLNYYVYFFNYGSKIIDKNFRCNAKNKSNWDSNSKWNFTNLPTTLLSHLPKEEIYPNKLMLFNAIYEIRCFYITKIFLPVLIGKQDISSLAILGHIKANGIYCKRVILLSIGNDNRLYFEIL